MLLVIIALSQHAQRVHPRITHYPTLKTVRINRWYQVSLRIHRQKLSSQRHPHQQQIHTQNIKLSLKLNLRQTTKLCPQTTLTEIHLSINAEMPVPSASTYIRERWYDSNRGVRKKEFHQSVSVCRREGHVGLSQFARWHIRKCGSDCGRDIFVLGRPYESPLHSIIAEIIRSEPNYIQHHIFSPVVRGKCKIPFSKYNDSCNQML